uniref:Uncharacterized protein n=1 Tax=Moniliophthora roreri TaxID=221103 RepID=A0A0W0FIZ8_MONRR
MARKSLVMAGDRTGISVMAGCLVCLGFISFLFSHLMGDQSQGLFSGVLNYVSREVGSFVTNATGGVISVNTGHQQPKKRVKNKKNAASSSSKPSSSSRTTMPGSLFPRSPSMAPTLCGDHDNADSDSDDQPGPSKRARHETPSERYGTPASFISSPSPAPSKRKGKQKAHTNHLDEYSDEDVLAMPPPPLPISRNPKGKERQLGLHGASSGRHSDLDTSGEIRVRGKERELDEAREEHMRNQQRWDRDRDKADQGQREAWEHDKERIRILEEEVRRLREELSKRSTGASTTMTSNHLPPPPPPPPPPPATLIRAPSSMDAQTLFASARASLKHAGTPTEAPINPAYSSLSSSTSGSRRTGKPTVGLQPDKMADFLKEMKTVRLRKVGLPPGEVDRSASFSFSTSSRSDSSLSRSNPSFRRESGILGDLSIGGEADASDLGHILNFRLKDNEPAPPGLEERPNGVYDSSGRKRKRNVDEDESSSRKRGQIPTPPNTTANVRADMVSSTASLPAVNPSQSHHNGPIVLSRQPSSFASTVSVDTDNSSASSSSSTSNKPRSTSASGRSKIVASDSRIGHVPSKSTLSQQRLHSPQSLPPMSKSPSARRISSTSSSPPPNALTKSQQMRIYTLPSGTTGPSRAWAPSAILPSQETPSLCSDLPEGSTSIDDDWHGENDDHDQDAQVHQSHRQVVPRVVVSPRPRIERGKKQKEIVDVDPEVNDISGTDMDVEDIDGYYPYRVNPKSPPLLHPTKGSASPTSPQDHDDQVSPEPGRLLTPFTEREPVPEPSLRLPQPAKPKSAAAAFSKRPPVSPMPVTPSPQRPRPPAGRVRGRGRALDSIRDTIVRVEPADTPDDRDSHMRKPSRSQSRSRPPTPYARVVKGKEREEPDPGDDFDEDPVNLNDGEDESSEDPLSLGGNTSAESILRRQSTESEPPRGRKMQTKKAGGLSKIPVARSGSLKGKKKNPGTKQRKASTSTFRKVSSEESQPRTTGLLNVSSRAELSVFTQAENEADDHAESSSAMRARRRTLDDELRSAVDARRSEDEALYEAGDDEEDADVAGIPKYVKNPKIQGGRMISAVGTRSKKKGYLAHGGGGGVPVFMGIGSVDGAEESDHIQDEVEDDDGDYVPASMTRTDHVGKATRRR